VGQYAGQTDTECARKVKIHLSCIAWDQVTEVLADPNKLLVAGYAASLTDGSPNCASVPLLGDGWTVTHQ